MPLTPEEEHAFFSAPRDKRAPTATVSFETTLELTKMLCYGKPKPETLTPAESMMWDQLEREIAEIGAAGGIVQLPYL